jgi:hypothetical protein
MTELQASRTLVKSPPELWAECSDAASLARHLGQFGEIRITRLDPETAVAWEGEHARGTVRIEPAGWGTKVVLTAVAVADDRVPAAVTEDHAPAAESEQPREPPADPAEPLDEAKPPRRRRFAWLFARRRTRDSEPAPLVEAAAVDPPEQEATDPGATPEPAAPEPAPATSATEAALAAALDSLGQAHHRPYSRA